MNVIDSHLHPIPSLTNPERLVDELDASGINKAVILAMDLDYKYVEGKKFRKELENRLAYTFIYDIDTIIAAMKFGLQLGHTSNYQVSQYTDKFPDRFIGFGSVNPNRKKYEIKKILKEIQSYNFKGIKLLPTLQFFKPSIKHNGLKEIFKFAKENDLPLMFHTGCDPGPWELPNLSEEANPILLNDLAQKYPEVIIILSHLGSYSAKSPGIWFEEAIEVLENNKNIWGDFSAVPYLLENKKTVQTLRRVSNFDKLLFGSDHPIITGGSIKESLERIKKSPFLTTDEKEKIFYKNAKRLFKL